jgi:acetate kinase
MRICEGLSNLGVAIDHAGNMAANRDPRQVGSGPIQVWVVPTQEELLIARDTLRCIAAAQ